MVRKNKYGQPLAAWQKGPPKVGKVTKRKKMKKPVSGGKSKINYQTGKVTPQDSTKKFSFKDVSFPKVDPTQTNKFQAIKGAGEQASRFAAGQQSFETDQPLAAGTGPPITPAGPAGIFPGFGSTKIPGGAKSLAKGLGKIKTDTAKEVAKAVKMGEKVIVGGKETVVAYAPFMASATKNYGQIFGATGSKISVETAKFIYKIPIGTKIVNLVKQAATTKWGITMLGAYAGSIALSEYNRGEGRTGLSMIARDARQSYVFAPPEQKEAAYAIADEALMNMEEASKPSMADWIMNFAPLGLNVVLSEVTGRLADSIKAIKTERDILNLNKEKDDLVNSGMSDAEAEMQQWNDNRDKQREIDLQIQLEKEKRYEDSRAEQEALDVAREERYDRREARSKADDAEERAYWEEVRAAELIKLEEERAYWKAVWEQKVKYNSESSRSRLSFGLFR